VVDGREYPSKGSKHGYTGVDNLCLTEPLERAASATNEPRAGGVVAEASGVETEVTRQGAIEVRGPLVHGESHRALIAHAHHSARGGLRTRHHEGSGAGDAGGQGHDGGSADHCDDMGGEEGVKPDVRYTNTDHRYR